ncbi:MAG: RNA polymerase sigma factor [Clostridiales Family XIII bacterium]|jgi:RNA polymerase sigma-70 factor (ECF subfamily)|nr:RNA polymerase sigma factor [Clostridiales Family XIII bacterium]
MPHEAPPRAEDVFTETYLRHVKTIYGLCFLYLQSAADAEDSVQTVFLKLLESRKTFRDCEHERAWLIVVAKNHCRNILKRRRIIRREDAEEAHAPATTPGDGAPHGEALRLLLSLPEKYRTVLYLHYIAGYATKELSRMLKRNENTIRTQLSRGRERLKIDLEGNDHA